MSFWRLSTKSAKLDKDKRKDASKKLSEQGATVAQTQRKEVPTQKPQQRYASDTVVTMATKERGTSFGTAQPSGLAAAIERITRDLDTMNSAIRTPPENSERSLPPSFRRRQPLGTESSSSSSNGDPSGDDDDSIEVIPRKAEQLGTRHNAGNGALPAAEDEFVAMMRLVLGIKAVGGSSNAVRGHSRGEAAGGDGTAPSRARGASNANSPQSLEDTLFKAILQDLVEPSLPSSTGRNNTNSTDRENLLRKLMATLGSGRSRNQKWLPLHHAAKTGNVDIVKALLAKGAEVDAREDDEWTPLFIAAKNGHDKVVRALLLAGADVNALTNYSETALGAASQDGHSECVRLLVGARAALENQNLQGHTPLGSASFWQRAECVKILLAAGANMETRDSKGVTPLLLAAYESDPEIVKTLIDSGADVLARSHNRWTALHFSTQFDKPGTLATVKMLVAAGADIHARTEREEATALHLACQTGKTDVISALIAAGSELEAKTTNGRTPLFQAVIGKHLDSIDLLWGAGSNIHATEEDGYTVLHVAVHVGSMDVMKKLLSIGCNINAKTDSGITALSLAIRKSQMEIFNLLLESGASIS